MSIKKLLSTLALSVTTAALFATSVSSYYSNRTNNTDKTVLTHTSKKSALNLNSVSDFDENAAEVDRGIFSVSVKSATVTPKAKSFEFGFESVKIKTFCNNTKSFFVAVDDDTFSDASDYAKPEEGEETPSFNAYIYHIEKGTSGGNVYLPEVFTYGSKFSLNVTSIGTECCVGPKEEGDTDGFFGITSIYIPASYSVIEKDAFINVPDSVTIYCEASEKQSGWDDEWTDASNIVFNASIDSKNKKAAYTAGGDKSFGDAVNFIVGSLERPLILEYTMINANGESRQEFMELGLTSALNPFDGVGSKLGSNSLTKIIDIEYVDGEEIDSESFTFHNIFTVKMSDDGVDIVKDSNDLPISDVAYKSVALRKYQLEYNLSDLITYSFRKISTFSGYTDISMNIDLVLPSAYDKLMPSVYKNNLDEINNGKYRIRYAFYNLTSASYEIIYLSKNGELIKKQLTIVTPISAFELSKPTGNKVSFLIKNSDIGEDFDPKNIKEFYLVGSSINVHLWDTVNNNKLGRSEFSKRFGHIAVLSENEEIGKIFDVDLFLILFFVCYVILFGLIATVLYFYLKAKYKNDEFRRMKTKPYIKKSVLGLVGSAVILLAVLFVILRTTALKDSIVVFNPADVFIVLAGLVALVIIGYFIKFLVATTKANKQRKTSIRLHLDKDVADDGTK